MQSVPIFDSLSLSNINSAVGAFVFEVLARLGVEMVVTCPGSRSTPLTFAAARNAKLETVSIVDERSAAFFALGHAKASGKPVVLVCTSGTAAANFLPAVVEAKLSQVPLIVITADRPFELRECSAGQVIDQVKMFGDFVCQFKEIGLPENRSEYFDYLRQTLVHVVHHSLGLLRGPQHLNFPFRDPLSPEEGKAPLLSSEALEQRASVIVKLSDLTKTKLSVDPLLLEKLSSHRNGIIVIGTYEAKYNDESFVDHIAAISCKLGWPILTDVLNPLRNHGDQLTDLITHYDAFLRDEIHSQTLRPSAILQIGKLPTSKVLRSWMSECNAQRFLFNEGYDNLDPSHSTSIPLLTDLSTLSETLNASSADLDWLENWNKVERLYERSIARDLENLSECFEGTIARMLSSDAPEGSSIFIANSMSVRYAESFWLKNNSKNKVFFNRGANGIDGTLSTAMGIAHKGKHTILLTGDLAFLHDSNGLLFSSKLKGSLTVVLVNNRGGGIFEKLPIAKFENYEDYFATPQQVSFSDLSRAHDIDYIHLEQLEELTDYLKSKSPKKVRVIEIHTDRNRDSKTFNKLNRAR